MKINYYFKAIIVGIFLIPLAATIVSVGIPLANAIDDVANISTTTTSQYTEIYTTEKVPGAGCQCGAMSADGKTWEPNDNVCGTITTRKYKCSVPTGLAGFQSVFASIIRYVINIVLLLGVLAVVGLGIAWSFAGGDDVKMKTTLKTWAINIVIGLIILFMFRYILMFLAPYVYQ